MNPPKFKIGEEVILQSKTRPDLNGEAIVFDVVEPGEHRNCRKTNKKIRLDGTGYGYRLEGILPIGTNGVESMFNECALKKKYDSNGVSFQEMMDTLKSGITEAP